jgi:pimeloyl-ACP methyl ester carboxylesterase
LEVGWLAFNVAIWPIGLVDGAVRATSRGLRLGPGRLISHQPASPKRRPASQAAETPIVLIHGYFHNSSGFMYMQRALHRRGFKNVSAFSYNPLRKTIPELAEKVARRVDRIVDETGAAKVHLVGHSLGGLLARYYVEQMGGAAKVRSVTTIGTPHHGTLSAYAGRSPVAKQMRPGSDLINLMIRTRKPRPVRYFSYYSNLDALVMPSRSAHLDNGRGNVTNILVHDLGHLSLLLSSELVASIATNLSELR